MMPAIMYQGRLAGMTSIGVGHQDTSVVGNLSQMSFITLQISWPSGPSAGLFCLLLQLLAKVGRMQA